jgi:DNA-directed RNA polymerase subunit alpha
MWKGFQKPKRLAAELESLTDKFGKFSAQPFERGWGTTVGNALRRALLSSIEGAAITAVKIEGVLHEFSSIPGVVEDATDIILNLKQVPLKLNNDQAKTIFVNVENPGVVTSAMIEEDADFAVLDKTVYIATVNEGGKLQLEMRIKNGRGYVSAERVRACLKFAPAERLSFAPDCGLSQTARWAARQKLKNLVAGVEIVRKKL